MNTVQSLWDTYSEQVMPRGAGKVQIIESKRAFYAGAACVLEILKAIGDNEEIDEEAGSMLLETLETDVDNFFEEVRAGHA